LTHLEIFLVDLNRELLCSIEEQRICARALGELERQDTHEDEVAAMDSLEALSNHGFNTL
jgi:hypothetical protein